MGAPVTIGDVSAEARTLTRAEAARYCKLKPRGFDRWVASGKVPGPLPGTRRWDRKAIDRAIDKLSGITDAPDHSSAFDDWLRGQEGDARAS